MSAQLEPIGVVEVCRLSHERFDVEELLYIELRHERKRPTNLAGATGPADTVDVVGRLARHVKIHHIANVGDVDTAREHVGRHEHVDLAIAERLECALALRLGTVAMDGRRLDACTGEAPAAAVRAMLGAHEHDHALRPLALENVRKQGVFRFGGYGQHVLIHRVGSALRRRDLHTRRVAHEVGYRTHGLLVQRGREEQGLAIVRRGPHDLAHIGKEPHVEHAIGLVKHEHLHLAQAAAPLAEEVDKTPRRGHEDIATVFESAPLRVVADASHDGYRVPVCAAARRSRPASTSGIAAACTGVGSV